MRDTHANRRSELSEKLVRITVAEYVGTDRPDLKDYKALVFSQEKFLEDVGMSSADLRDWHFESAEMPLADALKLGDTFRMAYEQGLLTLIEGDHDG
jgi:hypothetical protein